MYLRSNFAIPEVALYLRSNFFIPEVALYLRSNFAIPEVVFFPGRFITTTKVQKASRSVRYIRRVPAK